MNGSYESTYLDGSGAIPPDRLGARADAYRRAIDAMGARTVVAATSDRSRLAALVAACVASGTRVVFPHGFTSATVQTLNASLPDSVVVHDRADGRGLDLRTVADSGEGRIDLGAELARAGDERLFTFMTSGSTASPRPVEKRVCELVDEARILVGLLGIAPGESIGLGVPSTHLYGFLFGIVLPALVRVHVHVPLLRTRRDLPAESHLDHLVTSPPTLSSFASAGPADCLRGTRVVSSGSELRASVEALALAAGASGVLEIYGSTETGGVGYRRSTSEPFTAFPGVELGRSADDAYDVRSPHAAADGAAVALGDRIESSADGTFRFVERASDRVKIGGRRISTGHVESLLLGIAGVVDAAVRPRRASDARGSRLAALVVLRGTDAATVRAALAAELDAEFIPRPIVPVPAIARAPSGKLSADSFDRQCADGLRVSRSRIALRSDGEGAGFATIGADCRRLEGHFPEEPILPGISMLLDVVMPFVHANHADLGLPRRLTRVKFVRPVRPGDELRVSLARRTLDSIGFEITTSAGDKVSSGSLHFGAIPPAPGSTQ